MVFLVFLSPVFYSCSRSYCTSSCCKPALFNIAPRHISYDTTIEAFRLYSSSRIMLSIIVPAEAIRLAETIAPTEPVIVLKTTEYLPGFPDLPSQPVEMIVSGTIKIIATAKNRTITIARLLQVEDLLNVHISLITSFHIGQFHIISELLP